MLTTLSVCFDATCRGVGDSCETAERESQLKNASCVSAALLISRVKTETPILVATGALLLAGCGLVPLPSKADMESAELGDPPSEEDVRRGVDTVLDGVLKDPDSKKVRYGDPQKGSYRRYLTPTNLFAWYVPCEVNAKNGFGGYTGYKEWVFFFLQGNVVAWCDSRDGAMKEIGKGGLSWSDSHPKDQ